MICPSCKKENPEGSLFCNSCGIKILDEKIIYKTKEENSYISKKPVTSSKKFSKKVILLITIIIMFIGIAYNITLENFI